jgi:hypothetical protein
MTRHIERPPFVRYAPCADGVRRIAVEVKELDDTHLDLWNRHVQPFIASMGKRPDRNWNWSLIASTTSLFRLQGQEPAAYAATCVDDQGTEFPCAMLQIVGRYTALDSPGQSGVFVWYLADAPREALECRFHRPTIPRLLGRIALDTAVVHAMQDGQDGRTGLHAAPEGGDRLLKWYEQAGMKRLPRFRRIIRGARSNDGRYFFYDPEDARKAVVALNDWRN